MTTTINSTKPKQFTLWERRERARNNTQLKRNRIRDTRLHFVHSLLLLRKLSKARMCSNFSLESGSQRVYFIYESEKENFVVCQALIWYFVSVCCRFTVTVRAVCCIFGAHISLRAVCYWASPFFIQVYSVWSWILYALHHRIGAFICLAYMCFFLLSLSSSTCVIHLFAFKASVIICHGAFIYYQN